MLSIILASSAVVMTAALFLWVTRSPPRRPRSIRLRPPLTLPAPPPIETRPYTMKLLAEAAEAKGAPFGPVTAHEPVHSPPSPSREPLILAAELRQIEAALAMASARQATMESELEQALARAVGAEVDVSELRGVVTSLKEQREQEAERFAGKTGELEATIARINEDEAALRARVRDLEMQLKVVIAARDQALAEMEKLRQTANALHADLAQLRPSGQDAAK